VHEAADQLKKKASKSKSSILVTIRPLDLDTIIESIKKTNRLVIVEESFPRGQHQQRGRLPCSAKCIRLFGRSNRAPLPDRYPFRFFSDRSLKRPLPQVKDIMEAVKSVAYVA